MGPGVPPAHMGAPAPRPRQPGVRAQGSAGSESNPEPLQEVTSWAARPFLGSGPPTLLVSPWKMKPHAVLRAHPQHSQWVHDVLIHKRTDKLTQVSVARWKITQSEPNSLENPLLNPSRGGEDGAEPLGSKSALSPWSQLARLPHWTTHSFP